MPQIQIPTIDGVRFAKGSRGEIFGNIKTTKNIDFSSNRGKIRLSERLYRVYDSGDDADFGLPMKFIRTDADTTERWWALCASGVLFKSTNTTPTGSYAQDAIANTPTDAVDDMEIFGQASSRDRLVVARDDDLAMLNNGTWTASWWQTTLSQSALATTNPHPLHQFLNLLILTDGNKVHTIDDSLVVSASRLTFPKEYQVIWVADDGRRVYFGTKNLRFGQGYVFPWDGTSDTYDTPLEIDDYMTMAGCAKDGIMHTINTKGQLLAYNGQFFVEVDSLPCVDKPLLWGNSIGSAARVNANGMAVLGNELSILVQSAMSNSSSGNIFEDFPSGIWAYDPSIGLYQKYSLGQFDGATDNDWGSFILSNAGALTETSIDGGRFLAGASVWTDDVTTQVKGLFASTVATTTSHRGYFVTTQIRSKSVRGFWQRLQLVFKKFENSTDRIIVKYRTPDDATSLFQSDGTIESFLTVWSDTDTFTGSASNLASASVGDEVEILTGKGAGALAHIASISEAGGTYTVNLDEAIPNVSGDALVRIIPWHKLGTISSQAIALKLYKIAKRQPWIQFKVELRGTYRSPELEKLLLDYESSER